VSTTYAAVLAICPIIPPPALCAGACCVAGAPAAVEAERCCGGATAGRCGAGCGRVGARVGARPPPPPPPDRRGILMKESGRVGKRVEEVKVRYESCCGVGKSLMARMGCLVVKEAL
jgi:hypothetical protein